MMKCHFKVNWTKGDIIRLNSGKKNVLTFSDISISKYKNKKTIIDGVIFQSRKEGRRYQQLVLMLKAHQISLLKIQYPFNFLGKNNKKIFTYKADFYYFDLIEGKYKVEDTKGYRTPVYKLKKKLIEDHFGINIIEI